MITLCIDTSYKHLTCALIKDDEILSSVSMECFKKQSEEVFVCLKTVFTKAMISKKDIDSICVSVGPGSYTGTRIGITIAKTIGEMMPVDVYTISTLRLYASNNSRTMVILNARADRAYVGIYDGPYAIIKDCVMPVNEINPMKYEIVGDASLLGKEDNFPDIPTAFLNTKHSWEKIKNIAYLVPNYLKESESYLK